jgi:tetratricopeptide (TPR) repeat protein
MPRSADAYYQVGAAVGLQASYAATVEGRVLGGFRAARRAYEAHEKCLELDPSRKDAGLVVGTYRYIVATLTLPMRWMAYAAGFGGGREKGIRLIEEAAAYPGESQTDARLALILIYNREKRYDAALRLLHQLIQRYPRNRLFWLEAGSTALRAGRFAEAERILDEGFSKLAHDRRRRMYGEEALWRYKRGAARVALRRLGAAEQDLQAAVAGEARDWIKGRARTELGKVADLAGNAARAKVEYQTAIRLAEADNDPLGEAEARRLVRDGYR